MAPTIVDHLEVIQIQQYETGHSLVSLTHLDLAVENIRQLRAVEAAGQGIGGGQASQLDLQAAHQPGKDHHEQAGQAEGKGDTPEIRFWKRNKRHNGHADYKHDIAGGGLLQRKQKKQCGGGRVCPVQPGVAIDQGGVHRADHCQCREQAPLEKIDTAESKECNNGHCIQAEQNKKRCQQNIAFCHCTITSGATAIKAQKSR